MYIILSLLLKVVFIHSIARFVMDMCVTSVSLHFEQLSHSSFIPYLCANFHVLMFKGRKWRDVFMVWVCFLTIANRPCKIEIFLLENLKIQINYSSFCTCRGSCVCYSATVVVNSFVSGKNTRLFGAVVKTFEQYCVSLLLQRLHSTCR